MSFWPPRPGRLLCPAPAPVLSSGPPGCQCTAHGHTLFSRRAILSPSYGLHSMSLQIVGGTDSAVFPLIGTMRDAAVEEGPIRGFLRLVNLGYCSHVSTLSLCRVPASHGSSSSRNPLSRQPFQRRPNPGEPRSSTCLVAGCRPGVRSLGKGTDHRG